jgi:RNA recognition motif-containing protein
MTDQASATAAMESLRGTQINGRTLDIVLEERTRRRSAGSAGRAHARRRR